MKVEAENILSAHWGFARTQALASAVELKLFDRIADGKRTAQEIAQACTADGRGMRLLLNSLCGLSLLKKKGAAYRLTPESRVYLLEKSPMYLGGMVRFVRERWRAWENLVEAVKTGNPLLDAMEEEKAKEFYPGVARAIFPLSYLAASKLAKRIGVGKRLKNLEILDVACGSGAWSLAFLKRDKGSRAVGLDYPEVASVAQEFVGKLAVSGRFEILEGNLRTSNFGEVSYDVVILGMICHSLGEKESRALFSKSLLALKPGGLLVIAEIMPHNDKTKPLFPLLFALNMLVHTREGEAFTYREYREWLLEAGFRQIEKIDLNSLSALIAYKPH